MVTETKEIKVESLDEKKARVANSVAYKFRDKDSLSEAQLTDPDYSLKQIFGDNVATAVCSKCHHCR